MWVKQLSNLWFVILLLCFCALRSEQTHRACDTWTPWVRSCKCARDNSCGNDVTTMHIACSMSNKWLNLDGVNHSMVQCLNDSRDLWDSWYLWLLGNLGHTNNDKHWPSQRSYSWFQEKKFVHECDYATRTESVNSRAWICAVTPRTHHRTESTDNTDRRFNPQNRVIILMTDSESLTETKW